MNLYRKVNKALHAATTGLAILIFMGNNALAGSIILTGHDADDHGANDFMNWALTALLNNGDGTSRPVVSDTTNRIGYIGNSSASLGSYLGFYDNFEFYDLDLSNWTDAFTDSNDVLVIGSGFDFISSSGVNTLTNASSMFSNYFNNAGNLFVNSHNGVGASFYNFLPAIGNVSASNLTTCYSESGSGTCMSPSAAGSASGLLIGDVVNANITHNQFESDPIFTSLETYVPTGKSITIGLFEAKIQGGDFTTVPEPTTVAIFSLGLMGLVARRLKNK